MIDKPKTMEELFIDVFKEGIKRRAEEIFETKKQEMTRQLDIEKDELVAGLSLKLSQHIQDRKSVV